MMSNELLRQSLGNELGKFSEQMSKQLTTIFVDNYRSFTETTVKAEEKQKAQTENYLSELSNEITLLKLKIKRMYHFNRFKIALLWAGWIAVIILLLMAILRTFILKCNPLKSFTKCRRHYFQTNTLNFPMTPRFYICCY